MLRGACRKRRFVFVSTNAARRRHGSSSGEAAALDPDRYAELVDACDDPRQGQLLHARISALGMDANVFVGNRLVAMYLRFGRPLDARRAFSKMPNKGPVPWTSMIGALARDFHFHSAIAVFHTMLLEGIALDSPTYSTVISLSANLDDDHRDSVSRLIHSIALESGRDGETIVGTALVSMLPDFGDARRAFQKVADKDVRTWKAMMDVCMRRSDYAEVMRLFREMDVEPDGPTFVRALNACTGLGDLEAGRAVHQLAAERGFHGDVRVEAAIFSLYSNAKNLDVLFNYAAHHDSVVLWTRRMAASTKQGESSTTVEYFGSMQLEGIKPDRVSLLTVLDALDRPGFLKIGRTVHSDAREIGLGKLTSLMNAVMSMYARCGSLEEAIEVFEEIDRDVVSWNTIIGAYAQSGFCEEAFGLFHRMQLEAVLPDKITLLAMLTVSSRLDFSPRCKLIHACVVELGEEEDLASAIMAMYGKCGKLEDSAAIFASSSLQQNAAAWNSRIAASSQEGCLLEALGLYNQMLLQGVMPDRVTFLSLLDGAAILEAAAVVGRLRDDLTQIGFARDTFVATALLDSYSKCRRLDEARVVFESLDLGERNVVCWTAMVSACGQHGFFSDALRYYQLMQLQGEAPNKVTMAAVLTASSKVDLGADQLRSVIRIYEFCVEAGYDRELLVGNAALGVHAKLGNLPESRKIFSGLRTRSVVTWNSIVSAYAQAGRSSECWRSFREMLLESDSRPDKYTFVTMLGLCKQSPDAVGGGRLVHRLAEECCGLDLLLATALVTMYSECGSIDDALSAFGGIDRPDAVAWNSIISALSHHGKLRAAIDSFHRMKDSGVAPDALTFVAVINACTANSELDLGQRIFAEAVRAGLGGGVAAAGINLFGKCGKLEAAMEIFAPLVQLESGALAWNGLATALAHGARPKEVVELIQRMELWGVDPDSVTFVSLLSTLSHAGLVEDCCRFLSSMKSDYGLVPSATHYGCVVDVVGRAGLLEVAEEMVAAKLRSGGDDHLIVLWTSLLAACGIHGDSERGKQAVRRILEREPEDAASYVVLSSIS